jgi:hypothetical protein
VPDRIETPSPRQIEAEKIRTAIQIEHKKFIDSYLILEQVEHKSARQFEMGLQNSNAILEEIACHLQIARND